MAGHMRSEGATGGGTGLIVVALAFVLVAGCVAALVMTGRMDGLLGAVLGEKDADPATTVPIDAALKPKEPSAYSWAEFSEISAGIAGASSDEEGLEVARSFNLVDASGAPVEACVDVALADGTLAQAQLVGVRHDTCVDGSPTGLTFMLSVIADRPMCDAPTTSGGWQTSALRSWLASEGVALLPDELSERLVPVLKSTNNVGVARDGDAVTQTTDALWCFSAHEVCGDVTWFATEYGPTMAGYDELLDAEGSQYAYFSTHGVTGESDAGHALALTYRGASWAWWYRTPYPYVFMGEGDSGSFFQVTASGFPSSVGMADQPAGVVVGFCV